MSDSVYHWMKQEELARVALTACRAELATYQAIRESEHATVSAMRADLTEALRLLASWDAAYSRILRMAGWSEGQGDLWIGPELERERVATNAFLAKGGK